MGFLWGDNGASAEGQQGSISELLAQNNIPNTVEQQIDALEKLGGIAALGTPKTDNMYHAGWTWAGSTPFRSTKLVAAHFGGASGGLTLYMDKGYLVYEYNMMVIERYAARTNDKLAPGRHTIEVDTTLTDKKPLSPAEVVFKVDGREVARTTVKRTVPAAFTASETFDVGVDLGSPVSIGYFDRRPFASTGKIERVEVELK